MEREYNSPRIRFNERDTGREKKPIHRSVTVERRADNSFSPAGVVAAAVVVAVGRGAGEPRAEDAAELGFDESSGAAASSGDAEDAASAAAEVAAASGEEDAGSAVKGDRVCFSSDGVDDSSDYGTGEAGQWGEGKGERRATSGW